MRDEKMYAELVHKLRSQHETYKKWQRKIMNEPESEQKYAKIELMQKVIDRSREVVLWWDNYEAKAIKKEQHQKELERAAEKKRKKAAVTDANRLGVDAPAAPAPVAPEYNMRCRHHTMINKEHKCDIGMDMVFCSDRCAYCTNMVGSTKAYETPYYRN